MNSKGNVIAVKVLVGTASLSASLLLCWGMTNWLAAGSGKTWFVESKRQYETLLGSEGKWNFLR